MTTLRMIPYLIAISMVFGCGGDSGDDDAGGGGSAGFALRATSGGDSAGGGLELVDDSDTTYTLVEARLNLRDIELDLPRDVSCADIEEVLVGATCSSSSGGEAKIEIQGPIEVDLVANTTTPTLSDVEIPALSYRRIDFRVDDGPDDVSFAVVAEFERDGEPMTLDLSLDFSEDIRVEHSDGVDLTADSSLITEFVVDDWLTGINIESCINDGDVTIDGDVVIITDDSSSGSCSDIENVIKDNMKQSGQLRRG